MTAHAFPDLSLWERLRRAVDADARKSLCPECKLPPPGWWCSRPDGHEGPCAARPEIAGLDGQ